MSFTSLKFIVFFAGAAFGWYALPKRLKKPWLLLACYVFYMLVRPAFIRLLRFPALHFTCAEKSDGSYAAVKVQNSLSTFKICIFQHLAIEFYHLLSVHLIKGKRRNFKFHAIHFLCDGRLSG